MVVNNLYGNARCASEEIAISKDVILVALKNIYSDDFDAATDIEMVLFNEFWERYNLATDQGITSSKVDVQQEFIEQLKYNNGVFSAFKVHTMQGAMAARLVDDDGNKKPFKQWREDVQDIVNHQCDAWLRTEYITASDRAHQAARWKRFEEEADILPNLKWMPSTAMKPRELHKQFYGIIRPIDDEFWNHHRPQDLWGCMCDLEATDEEATPLEDMPVTVEKPSPGLDNNPAHDGKLFSDTHPYIAKSGSEVDGVVLKTLNKVATERIKVLRKEAKSLVGKKFTNIGFGYDMSLTNKGVKEWLNQPHKHRYIKNELILNLDKLIQDSKYIGQGTDKWDKDVVAHLFEVDIAGEKSWIIAREMSKEQINIHSISDSDEILNIIKKTD